MRRAGPTWAAQMGWSGPSRQTGPCSGNAALGAPPALVRLLLWLLVHAGFWSSWGRMDDCAPISRCAQAPCGTVMPGRCSAGRASQHGYSFVLWVGCNDSPGGASRGRYSRPATDPAPRPRRTTGEALLAYLLPTL